nr:MAG: structural polyprotein [Aparavirus sp.]
MMTDVQMSAEVTPMPSTTNIMALNDTTTHDIRTILERPVNINTYEWASTDGELSTTMTGGAYDGDTVNYLQKFDFPQQILSSSAIVADKLKNYQYLKADIEIEVKVNAQPFLQGALMLVYNPYLPKVGAFRRKGTRFLASQTSCPYKVLSLEEGNSLKMICPYSNIYDLFDLSNENNQFGTVYLYVFSQLRGAELPVTCKYTVYARFVNPQFYVPTQNALSTLEHDIARLEMAGYRVKRREGRRAAEALLTPACAPDSGETKTGPLSTGARGVSLVADALSGVPVIGKVASTVAWVSRLAARGLAAIGLSKTISVNHPQSMIVKPNTSLIHTEGVDDSTTLALLQDNGIDGTSFVPEWKDELSLSYIFGRPNFFHRKFISGSDFSGRKLLTKWEVSPFSSYQSGASLDLKTMFLGSFAYTSMFGTLWRGTINYDIKIIKTTFHQGRFVMVFLPETVMADVPTTLGTLLTTNYNVVCNLKDRQDELGRVGYRVSVPFISNTPWRETYKRDDSGLGPNPNTLETATGCIAIYSLVDLSSPPTTDDGITIMVAHSGGEDYQISRPTLQLAPGFQARYAQSDLGPVFIPKDENLLVPSHTMRDVTAGTTGEYFTSLRSLIKRFGYFADMSQYDTGFVGFRTRHFTENAVSGVREMSRAGTNDRVVPSPWYMVSFLYRFYNGSSNLKIIPSQPVAKAQAFLSFDDDPNVTSLVPFVKCYGQPLFEQLQMISNAFEIRTPFYRAIRGDVVNFSDPPVLGDVRTNVRIFDGASPDDPSTPNLFEAAGDDFNFYFLVGPPPMMDIANVVSTVTFPTLLPVSVDFTTVTGAVADNPRNVVSFDPVTIKDRTGADLEPAAPGYYKLTTNLTPPTVTFNDAATEARTWDNIFLYWDGSAWSLTIRPIAQTSMNVDLTTTQASVFAIGTDTTAELSDVANPYV